jgi:hypothetical protein
MGFSQRRKTAVSTLLKAASKGIISAFDAPEQDAANNANYC